jgi:hypothetical protein
MDIEGAEYDVLDDILGSKIDIGQILLEFHHRHSGVPLERTQAAIESLERAGFRAFHESKSGHEFSFLHADSFLTPSKRPAPRALGRFGGRPETTSSTALIPPQATSLP